MSLPENEAQGDWEITPEGLYIATRHFLIRRGYCCSNRCRNCPYINWQNNPAWEPAPAAAIRRTRVAPKVLAGIQASLLAHQQALSTYPPEEQSRHLEIIKHYERLLKSWW